MRFVGNTWLFSRPIGPGALLGFVQQDRFEPFETLRLRGVEMVRPEITGRDVGQPLVATPNQAMTALGIGRAKLYEKINAGELESYVDGGSRKILWDSIHGFIKVRLAAEAERRGRAA
jgi:predicted DNA-binding transcriptional regulator AlpA